MLITLYPLFFSSSSVTVVVVFFLTSLHIAFYIIVFDCDIVVNCLLDGK